MLEIAGKYQDQPGAAACKDCPGSSFSSAGALGCSACPAGTAPSTTQVGGENAIPTAHLLTGCTVHSLQRLQRGTVQRWNLFDLPGQLPKLVLVFNDGSVLRLASLVAIKTARSRAAACSRQLVAMFRCQAPMPRCRARRVKSPALLEPTRFRCDIFQLRFVPRFPLRSQGASTCTECPAGTYETTVQQGGQQQQLCAQCDYGQHTNTSGRTACSSCLPGSYQSARGQSVCELCAPQTYTSNPGAAKCLSCIGRACFACCVF